MCALVRTPYKSNVTGVTLSSTYPPNNSLGVWCAAEADYGQAVSIELLKEEAWLKA
jgi:hypothetical protein